MTENKFKFNGYFAEVTDTTITIIIMVIMLLACLIFIPFYLEERAEQKKNKELEKKIDSIYQQINSRAFNITTHPSEGWDIGVLDFYVKED